MIANIDYYADQIMDIINSKANTDKKTEIKIVMSDYACAYHKEIFGQIMTKLKDYINSATFSENQSEIEKRLEATTKFIIADVCGVNS